MLCIVKLNSHGCFEIGRGFKSKEKNVLNKLIKDGCNNNGLALNSDKCEYMKSRRYPTETFVYLLFSTEPGNNKMQTSASCGHLRMVVQTIQIKGLKY